MASQNIQQLEKCVQHSSKNLSEMHLSSVALLLLLVLFSIQTLADTFHQQDFLIVYVSSFKMAFGMKEHALGWHPLLHVFNVLLASLVIAREGTGSFYAKQPSRVPAFPKEGTKDLGTSACLSCTTTKNRQVLAASF